MDLKDRVVLITGASAGIGRALALRLAAEGCRLVLVARSEEKLAVLAAELGGPDRAVYIAGDVADPSVARRAVDRATGHFGRLDILVNNAGVGLRAPVTRLDPDLLAEIFSVNVLGALHFLRAAVPHLVEAGSGSVVTVASLAARQPVPTLGGYAATKAALVALTDALRLELTGTGVSVLTVLPGSVETEFKHNSRGEVYPERSGARRLSAEATAARIVERMRRPGSGRLYLLSRSERLGLAAAHIAPRLIEKKLIKRYGSAAPDGKGSSAGDREPPA